MTTPTPVLDVRQLRVSFDTERGSITAVDGISFAIAAGTTVALVGESGCGKTVTAMAIMRLLHRPPAHVSGEIALAGSNLLTLSPRDMRNVRGGRIGMVFQDPNAALNPVYRVGSQLVEAYRMHRSISRPQARRLGIALLQRVGLPEAERHFDHYPHQLSGGMRQRVMIAIALCCDPQLLIADEPTTALDMLAAAQVTSLLADLRQERNMSMLLISHDIASVADNADQVVVMYAGQVVETGPCEHVLQAPCHPYTQALLRSVPPLRSSQRRRRPTPTRLATLSGSPPNPHRLPPGCRFAPRCPEVRPACEHGSIALLRAPHRQARCLRLAELAPTIAFAPPPGNEP